MALIKSHAVGMEREEFWEVWTPHLEKSAAASGLLVVFLICELSLNFVTEDDRRETNVFTLPDAETDKSGLYRTVQRCSYGSDTDTNASFRCVMYTIYQYLYRSGCRAV